MISVLVTTQYKGVWFAQVAAGTDLTPTTLTDLKNCRMAIKWNTTKGLQELADVGPVNSKISPATDIRVLHGVTAVFDVKPEAEELWLSKEA